MEQARYWMWAMRKHASLMASPAHHHQVPDDNSSWEEQAFAEDAAGPLGGCIWPPRSYSCTFCRREFRSAQALGGHMNVHRRDRARLKQSSPNDQNVETALHHDDQNHHHQDSISLQINPFSSSSLATFPQYPTHHQVYAAVVHNPSSDPPSSSSSSPASRVSAARQLPGHHHQEQIPIPSSRSSPPPPPPSRSILTANRYYSNDNNSVARIKPEGADNISRIVESAAGSTCRANKVTTDLSVSLSLNPVVRCSRPPSAEDDEEAIITCKRRRVVTDHRPEIKQQSNSKGTSLPFILKSEGFKLLSSSRPSSIEELDLELRLGDRPNKELKALYSTTTTAEPQDPTKSVSQTLSTTICEPSMDTPEKTSNERKENSLRSNKLCLDQMTPKNRKWDLEAASSSSINQSEEEENSMEKKAN